MSSPKPAPSKPLTFTPPVFLKGESKPSELPTVEGADSNVMSKRKAPKFKKKGFTPNVVMIDEPGSGAIEIAAEDTKTVEKPKKPFVLDAHLTQRPFHDDRLMQLKNRLQRPSFKNR